MNILRSVNRLGLGCCVSGIAAWGVYCGLALAQQAEPPVDAARAMAGIWEFSNADHDKICHFTFGAAAAIGGFKLDIDEGCPSVFPSTKDIVAWAMDEFGTLRLLDAQGNTVIELDEAESGIYDGFEPGQGRYVLQNEPSAPVRSADNMVGDWAVARGTGKPICNLALANNPAGADSLSLRIGPGCDPFVMRFNPAAWRVEDGELVLLSARGQIWRFEENDANTWQRIPESADPVLLVRQ